MKKHNTITIILGLIYLLHRFVLQSPLPYFNDLLCLPVIAGFSLIGLRLIFKSYQRLSGGQVIFIVVYVTLVFEFLLPAFSLKYTGDPWDVLVYQAGGAAYYFLINPRKVSV